MGDCFATIGPIALGDCGNKTDIKIEKNRIIQNSSKSVQASMTSNQSSTVNLQQQKVNVLNKRPGCCDPLFISQEGNIKMINTNRDTTDMASSMISSITSEIESQLSAAQSSETDIASTPASQKLLMSVKESLTQINQSEDIKNSVKENMAETFNLQSQEVNIVCGDYPLPSPPKAPVTGKDDSGKTVTQTLPDTGCYITQDFLFEAVANNTFETVMKTIVENENVAKAVEEYDLEQKSKAKGLGAIVSSFFDAYKTTIIVVVIGLVVALPLLIWAFSKMGGSDPLKAAAAAKQAAKEVASAAKSTGGQTLQRVMQRLRQNIRR